MYYAFICYLFCSSGAASLSSVNLKGRSCLTLKDFSSDEIKRLLWVSGDLKHRIKHEKQVCNCNFACQPFYFIYLFYYFLLCSLCVDHFRMLSVFSVTASASSSRKVNCNDIWEEEHQDKNVHRNRCMLVFFCFFVNQSVSSTMNNNTVHQICRRRSTVFRVKSAQMRVSDSSCANMYLWTVSRADTVHLHHC